MLKKILIFIIAIIISFLIYNVFSSPKTINLLELSKKELKIYEEFKKDYNEEVLRGVKPISICKMYFYARYSKDYETEYELYIKDSPYVHWTKQEHMSEKNNNKRDEDNFTFDKLKSVRDIRVRFRVKTISVSWVDGDKFDRFGNRVRKVFLLGLNKEGIYKVHFVPIR